MFRLPIIITARQIPKEWPRAYRGSRGVDEPTDRPPPPLRRPWKRRRNERARTGGEDNRDRCPGTYLYQVTGRCLNACAASVLTFCYCFCCCFPGIIQSLAGRPSRRVQWMVRKLTCTLIASDRCITCGYQNIILLLLSLLFFISRDALTVLPCNVPRV